MGMAHREVNMDERENKVKTHFKGPGQWRSQAAELEKEEVDVEEESE